MIVRLVAAVLAAVMPASASAMEYRDWRNVAGWRIQQNIENEACQLSAVYEGEGETILMLTYTPSTDTANLGLGNMGWKSLNEGDNPKVTIDFGTQGRWSDVATTVFVTTDYHWLNMNLNGADFLIDFAASSAMRVTNGDVVVDKLALKGTKAAVLALVECAKQINKGIARDPFKK